MTLAARVGPGAIGLDPARFAADAPDWLQTSESVPVSVGNPHIVVFTDDLSDEALHRMGPFLATHPAITDGANVQLAHVNDGRVRIRIWERGVGPTTASGTSASAVVVAAVHTGRLDPGEHEVQMDGGVFNVLVDSSLEVVLRGPVEEIAEGHLTGTFLVRLGSEDK